MTSSFPGSVSRRDFLQSAATAAGAAALPVEAVVGHAAPPASGAAVAAISTSAITLRVNHRTHELSIEPRLTLLDALREHLNLVGTKKGCDRGRGCACTVARYGIGRLLNAKTGRSQPPWRMPFITRRGFAFGICPSPWTRYSSE